MSKFGFIGLGSQGAPMAQRMIDGGLLVVLWARRPETLTPFADSGAEFASSIAELAALVDYVGICVVDDDGVRAVCDELFPAMRPGGRVVIHSTVTPALCRQLASRAAEKKLELLDAPVSGGGQGAAAGTLTVMVGGNGDTLEAVRPALECFAGLIVHLGDVGSGQTAKLVNNAVMAANLAIAHHGLEAASTLGIERDAFVELVKVSSGRSFGFEVAARMDEPRSFSQGASLLDKDIRLLQETLGEDPSFRLIREAARSFLDLALGD